MGLTVLATGGYFDDSGEGVIFALDLDTGGVADWARWTPPPHLRVPTKGFTGCDRAGRSLYVCGHACVTRWSLDTAALEGVLHQPDFNDLHDVAVEDDDLLVVVTGSDAVDRFDLGGRFLSRTSLLPGWVLAAQHRGQDVADLQEATATGWGGAAPVVAARHVSDPYYTTRSGPGARPFWQQKVPDQLHLNHVAPSPDGPLVTCLRDGSVRSLRTARTVAQLPGHPHDGQVEDAALWCTTVDGGVWRVPLQGGEDLERRYDTATAGYSGWCRGLLVTPELVLVGLTALRQGQAPPGMWRGTDPGQSRTGVVVLDRQTGDVLQWLELTDPDRGLKLFALELLP